MKKLIGICGYAGAGKDTLASILVEQGFKKGSFAKPLKDAVSAIFGWDRELLEGLTKESREFREKVDTQWSTIMGRDITPRYMMQYFGTEICRDMIHKEIWINSFKNRYFNSTDSIVISDVRFVNEAVAIKQMGGKLIYIYRNGVKEYNHASEDSISVIRDIYADEQINNSGSIEDLRRIVIENTI